MDRQENNSNIFVHDSVKDAVKFEMQTTKKPAAAKDTPQLVYKFSAKNKTHIIIDTNRLLNQSHERPIHLLNITTTKGGQNIHFNKMLSVTSDPAADDDTDHECDTEKTPPKVNKQNVKNNYDKELTRFLLLIARSFKKSMKRSDEIRKLRRKIQKVDNDYKASMNQIKRKLKDLQTKQVELVMSTKNISDIQNKISLTNSNHERNEQELSNLAATYSTQQQILANHQKLLQNLDNKVSSKNVDFKDTMVAGVLSEIVKKQNNFIKILNQLKKHCDPSMKTNANNVPDQQDKTKTQTTSPTQHSSNSESAKINMLPMNYVIAKKNNIDETKLLKDKEIQNIDDLVYKYYFNNTFIETTIKNDLANVFEEQEADKVKSKRTELDAEKTILLPIEAKPAKRNKRWIIHKYSKNVTERHSTNHHRYPHELTEKNDKSSANNHATKDNRYVVKTERNYASSRNSFDTNNVDTSEDDPYSEIAARFCNKIGQDTDAQSLDWCIEKVTRKLASIATKTSKKVSAAPSRQPFRLWRSDTTKAPVVVAKSSRQFKKVHLAPTEAEQKDMSWLNQEISSLPTPDYTVAAPLKVNVNHLISISSTPYSLKTGPLHTPPPSRTLYTASFFPDNDKLEFNIRQSDLKADTAGNVYYDSYDPPESVVRESKTVSDILPDENSDSRFIVDPYVLELQSRRRAYLRRYNSILKKTPL